MRPGKGQDGHADLVCSSGIRSPSASRRAFWFAQKCMKKSPGSSVSMWVCSAVTAIPCQGPEHRVHLLGREDNVTRDGRFPVADRLKVDRRGDADCGGISVPSARTGSARATVT
jgi:hypothetical protein